MAHHQFRDQHGVLWEAWDVYPTSVERRRTDRRRNATGGGSRQLPIGSAERRRLERRQMVEPRAAISPEYIGGWVVFQSSVERRRLAPIPDRWDEFTEEELRTLCRQAANSSRPRRLIE